jgi:hypothetical protein
MALRLRPTIKKNCPARKATLGMAMQEALFSRVRKPIPTLKTCPFKLLRAAPTRRGNNGSVLVSDAMVILSSRRYRTIWLSNGSFRRSLP